MDRGFDGTDRSTVTGDQRLGGTTVCKRQGKQLTSCEHGVLDAYRECLRNAAHTIACGVGGGFVDTALRHQGQQEQHQNADEQRWNEIQQ